MEIRRAALQRGRKTLIADSGRHIKILTVNQHIKFQKCMSYTVQYVIIIKANDTLFQNLRS